jgi:hypothetical protein
MPRTLFVGLLALALLALLTAGKAVAGPPEGAPGKMVLDEVADGLRKYHKETDEGGRIKWLRKLARTQDPRVGLALGEALSDPSPDVREASAWFLTLVFYKTGRLNICGSQVAVAMPLWKENEADLRRRAKQLP